MVNLLPRGEQRKLRVLYYSRLLSACFVVLAGLCVAGTLFLLPSYMSAEARAASAQNSLGQSLVKTNQNATSGVGQALLVFKERITLLKEYHRQPVSSYVLSRILSALPKGVRITAITFVFSGEGTGKVMVLGRADTRIALIEFGKGLESERSFIGASVPVSNLVSDSNIAFSLPFEFDLKKI